MPKSRAPANLRRTWFLLLFLCLSIQAQAPGQATAGNPAQRLVTVNVIVRNPQAAPAALTRDDFRVFDRGQPRSIASFEAFSPGDARPPAAQLPPLVYVNQPAGGSGSAGATAILLDGLNTHIEDAAAARRQLLKFLGRIPPTARVGVYLMGSRLRVMQPLASGAAADPNLAGVEEMAAVFSGNDLELHSYGPPERAARTAEQLVQLARHLGRVPGRKNLIWLTGGIPLAPWDGDPASLSPDMARAARALSDSGIALYPVDAAALFTPRKRRAGTQTLERLAALTGGRAFTAPDEVLEAVGEVLRESAVSYTLEFAAEAAGPALEFRELRIQAAQPGLQLAYPRGYLAGPVPSPQAARERELLSLLNSPLEAGDVSLRLELSETVVDGNPAVKLHGSVPGSDFAARPDGAGVSVAMDISCHQMSLQGRDLGGFDATLALTLDAAQAQRFRQTGSAWDRSVRPSAGAVQLRIAAYDRNSGRTGSLFVPLPRPAAAAAPEVTFRAESNLALVRFQVTPKSGQLVADLRPEDIVVKEDGVPQKIAVFQGGRFYPRTVPAEISLLFDCSGSMDMAGLINPQVFEPGLLEEFENVRIATYGFSDSLTRFTTPTRDPEALRKAAAGVWGVPHGNTPLFRTIGAVAREAASMPGYAIRMVVIFSDGEAYPTDDLNLREKTVSDAQELGVALYPVTLAGVPSRYSAENRFIPPDPKAAPIPLSSDMALSRERFAELGKLTGGQAFHETPSTDVLPRILRTLARQIRFEYVAGYYHAAATASGKRRQVTVTWSGAGHGDIIGGTRAVLY